ncbi:MAG TPA: hypothetical protein VFD43_07170 [Planctomycetota bacterium]|nr:hypothetical protein [Planctomycetota bacterium]
MRRKLVWVLAALTALAVILIALVAVRAAETDPLPPPDPGLPIRLADGTLMPLAEVIDHARAGLALSRSTAPPGVEPLLPPADAEPADFAQVFELARQAADEGRLEEALALYLSIPREDATYARARRLVAWNILARDMHQPACGVRYINDSFFADPFEPKVWEDLWRVYGHTLGLPTN